MLPSRGNTTGLCRQRMPADLIFVIHGTAVAKPHCIKKGWKRNSGTGLPESICTYFQNKNTILGKFWRVLKWKMVVYFMSIWYILQLFGIFYGHSVYFLVIWYIFPVSVCCSKKNLATLHPMSKV
jgi:hypothetical protein